MMHFNSKLPRFFSAILKVLSCVALVGVCLFSTFSCQNKKQNAQSIKVGILSSKTGPMAIEEKPIIEAILMAIEEINLKGGLLGSTIEPIVFDGASDPENYIKGAKQLIEHDQVVAIFGGGNSISRRNIRPIIEKHENILVFPMHYEGGRPSPHIVYVGAAPNQQIIPGVDWAFRNLGSKFFLIGTDSIYSHVANEIIKDFIYALNGELVGESYISIDNTLGLSTIVERIEASKPDVILNTIEGPNNLEFFKLLRKTSSQPNNIPTISYGLTENLLKNLTGLNLEKDYALWSYFQNLDNKKNQTFEEAFFAKYGTNRAIDDPMESAYVGVYLWAQAVTDGNSFNPHIVLKNIPHQSFIAPSGLIYIDRETHSAYRPVRVGLVQADNHFKVIWDSGTSIMPVQYTVFKTPEEWDEFIKDLYEKWGRQWFRGKE